MEIWQKIKDTKIYEVSNLGNVRSVDRIDRLNRHKKGKILKQEINKRGYKYVTLVYDNKCVKKTIHRLVAETFLGNKKNLVVNHKDGNKTNNALYNLELITQKENIKHSWDNKLSHRTRCKKIVQYDKNNNIIKIYEAIMDAERETGINNSKISACCKGKYGRKTAGGYKWRYFNEIDI